MADSVPATGRLTGVGTAEPVPARDDIAGLVLAAGAGTRLRPLTALVPKAMCPVANRPLVDLAVDAVAAAGMPIAVNAHHGRDRLVPHLEARGVHVSIEEERALGTAGAVGHLRAWLDGRAVLVVNADAWCHPDLATFVAGWDGARVRILVSGDEPFGPRSRIVGSILPGPVAAGLEAVPSGLWETCWRDLVGTAAIDTAVDHGPFVDCGTPSRYLAANRWATALATGAGADGAGSIIHPSATIAPGAVVEASVIGAGAVIEGSVRRSVVWADQAVQRAESLDHAIRADHRMTVLVR